MAANRHHLIRRAVAASTVACLYLVAAGQLPMTPPPLHRADHRRARTEDPMSDYADRMAHHIAEFERWDRQCQALEAAMLVKLYREGRIDSTAKADEYLVARELENHYWYKRAASTRNGNQQGALMYGIAALVDRKEPSYVDRR